MAVVTVLDFARVRLAGDRHIEASRRFGVVECFAKRFVDEFKARRLAGRIVGLRYGRQLELRGLAVDDDAGDPALFAAVVTLLEELGDVVAIDEAQFGVLTGISGVGPAYLALVAQTQVDVAVAQGMELETAKRLVGSTLKGSSALLVSRSYDSEQICREVATPGGVTEKGLAALAGPLRDGFKAAMDAVLGRST